ncbi:hypothetical protein F442_09345 [Phytophthora nicotianae P10297]|uniref:Uncharacterized protein n=1 Tax=Phytophthora nicotianae P10297 TaxID=1317064 RepID=W2ZAC2_PHYNI|nr:hypothetical protein F442_09345 [Phytophthora nicotianae P10297]
MAGGLSRGVTWPVPNGIEAFLSDKLAVPLCLITTIADYHRKNAKPLLKRFSNDVA